MIKETKIQKETIILHKYCDVCGEEIEHSLACMAATCEYCGNDLCEKCIGHEEETGSDYRIVWCSSCWQIGNEYRPMIKALAEEVEMLYKKWRSRCNEKEEERA
jgi:hypothetical protein